MKNTVLIPLALAFSVALPLGLSQERVKKKEAKDFAGTHEALGEAWKAGQYSKSLELTRELMNIVTAKRTEMILAAMPAAPEGWEVRPQKKNDAAQNPFGAAMAASVGSVITQEYRETGGRGRLELTVTAGSPLVQMFKMWVANPQMLGPDAEHIKYEQCDAVLKKEGSNWNLQILIGDDFCEAKLTGGSDDLLLKVMNQAAVDSLVRALSA